MSRMRTRPTSEQLPQALNRSRDLVTCLTATDERRFEIRGGTLPTRATNGHSRNSEAPLTPRKPSEFPCTSVRASSPSQRARFRKKVRPYNAAEPRKSDRFPGEL